MCDECKCECDRKIECVVDVVPSEGDLLALTNAAIKAQQDLERAKQLRRLKANLLRTEANKLDADTDLAINEFNEIPNIPYDLHPVEPPEEVDDQPEDD